MPVVQVSSRPVRSRRSRRSPTGNEEIWGETFQGTRFSAGAAPQGLQRAINKAAWGNRKVALGDCKNGNIKKAVAPSQGGATAFSSENPEHVSIISGKEVIPPYGRHYRIIAIWVHEFHRVTIPSDNGHTMIRGLMSEGKSTQIVGIVVSDCLNNLVLDVEMQETAV
jgi:hypothetical protein